MLVDPRSLPDGARVDTDLCIIGAGAAGIAIAREWAGSDHSVVLLESGGFEPDATVQALTRGEASGNVLANPETYLSRSRLRYFGGSTNHWGGSCRPLDELDFETRPWVADSGWPFERSTLDPYYERARRLVEVAAFDYDIETSHPRGRAPLWSRPEDSGLDTAVRPTPVSDRPKRIGTMVIHFSPPTRFGQRFRETIVSAKNVSLHLHANAVALETDADGARLASIRVARLDGSSYRVWPRVTVLATGGIENPRLLLASNQKRTAGLGNHHDRVGRYFMDHLAIRGGHALFTLPFATMALYRPGHDARHHSRSMGLLTLDARTQREQKLLGFSVRLRRVQWNDLDSRQRALLRSALCIDRLDAERPPLPADADAHAFIASLEVVAESSPRPDSRVTLAERRDPLGLPLARVDWQVDPADYQSMLRSLELMAAELGSRSRGRVRPMIETARNGLRPRTGGWSHHMGTTRMHSDPKFGVVDANCRVHSVSNLYIAGSSVFPTGGSEGTTTLTLLALALRLSDRLKRELSR